MGYNVRLMVKVAKLYYKEKLSQLEIAKKIKISKYQITRLIKMAEKTGVVQINIIDPTTSISELEEKLEEEFDLKRAIVVDNKGLSNSEISSKLGQEAAKYLLESIKDGDIIGISWGSTVNEVVNALPSKINKKVEIVQIIGAIHQLSVQLSSHDLAKRFAAKFGVEPLLLFSPSIVLNKKTKKLFLEDYSIKKVFKYFDKLTIALYGIGNLQSIPFVESEYITIEDINSLNRSNTVGDVIGNHYDINGKISETTLADRQINISLKQIKKVPYAMAVAGGEEKADAILGALRGKYLKILVIDSKVAEKVLKISK